MNIPLTQGKHAIIDDEDFEWLNQWKWTYSYNGYAYRRVSLGYDNGKRKRGIIFMHRAIINTPVGMDTDHINNNRLDNRKSNLRACTKTQNRRNQLKTRGTSKYKGVRLHKCGKWQAGITIKNIPIYLGLFDNEHDAATAYNMAALRNFREYAKLNMIGGLCAN